ncbi:similar to Uncharacterized conserved protein [Crocosphaera watsonii WH 0401]|uniref:Similar to Uncharacterized conserved protein n=2 Tax=Crocosphaera watsonii TaxID=263511 RepID=T2J3Q4_CROWT|nr:similar to Uncharacterized conserved protein [Crocosphaera watsonii WH 0401]
MLPQVREFSNNQEKILNLGILNRVNRTRFIFQQLFSKLFSNNKK